MMPPRKSFRKNIHKRMVSAFGGHRGGGFEPDFSDLPKSVIEKIFGFVSRHQDKIALEGVNKKFREISKNVFWNFKELTISYEYLRGGANLNSRWPFLIINRENVPVLEPKTPRKFEKRWKKDVERILHIIFSRVGNLEALSFSEKGQQKSQNLPCDWHISELLTQMDTVFDHVIAMSSLKFQIRSISLSGFWFLIPIEKLLFVHRTHLSTMTIGPTEGMSNRRKSALWKTIQQCQSLKNVHIDSAEVFPLSTWECRQSVIFERALWRTSLTSLALPPKCPLTTETLVFGLSESKNLQFLSIKDAPNIKLSNILKFNAQILKKLKILQYHSFDDTVEFLTEMKQSCSSIPSLLELHLLASQETIFLLFELMAEVLICGQNGREKKELLIKWGTKENFLTELMVEVALAVVRCENSAAKSCVVWSEQDSYASCKVIGGKVTASKISLEAGNSAVCLDVVEA